MSRLNCMPCVSFLVKETRVAYRAKYVINHTGNLFDTKISCCWTTH